MTGDAIGRFAGSGSWAGRLARRGLRRVKYMLGYSPATLPIYLWIGPRLLGISDTSKVGHVGRITDETDLVIEGFPRSGNTYCAETFRLVGGPGFEVVSHVHHVAQVKSSIRRGVPTILVVREPVGCLASYLVAGPHATVRGVLREYIAYHEGLHRQIPSCMVVDFAELTSDVDAAIGRANRLFGMDLRMLSSLGTTEDVFEAIEQDHLDRYKGAAEMTLPKPDAERRAINDRYRAALTDPRNAALLEGANAAYRSVLERGIFA